MKDVLLVLMQSGYNKNKDLDFKINAQLLECLDQISAISNFMCASIFRLLKKIGQNKIVQKERK
jgi:hypothetical protein